MSWSQLKFVAANVNHDNEYNAADGITNVDINLIVRGLIWATFNVSEDTVGTVQLKDSAVTTVKINNGAVTEGKIASNAVTTGKIAGGAVTEAKLANGAVTENKIGSGAVTEAKIGAGAVTNTKLGDGSVTEGKVANNAISWNKLATALQDIINGKAPTNHASTGTEYGVGDTTHYGHVKVDAAIDGNSTNPVQNKAIKGALDLKADLVNGKVPVSQMPDTGLTVDVARALAYGVGATISGDEIMESITAPFYFKGKYDVYPTIESGTPNYKKVTRQTKYLNLSKFILDNANIGFFRGSRTGHYQYGPIGHDTNFLPDAASTLAGVGNYGFHSGDAWSTDNYVFGTMYVALPNTYDTKDKYLQYFTEHEVFIQYQLATSYTEEVIEGVTLLPLDSNMTRELRELAIDGLNLFDINNQVVTFSGITLTIRDGAMTLSGTSTSAGSMFIDLPPVLLNGIYTFALNETTSLDGFANLAMYFYDTDGNHLFLFDGSHASTTKTAAFNNKTLGKVQFYVASGRTINYTIKPMLNEGDHASPYVSYHQSRHITDGQAKYLFDKYRRASNLLSGEFVKVGSSNNRGFVFIPDETGYYTLSCSSTYRQLSCDQISPNQNVAVTPLDQQVPLTVYLTKGVLYGFYINTTSHDWDSAYYELNNTTLNKGTEVQLHEDYHKSEHITDQDAENIDSSLLNKGEYDVYPYNADKTKVQRQSWKVKVKDITTWAYVSNSDRPRFVFNVSVLGNFTNVTSNDQQPYFVSNILNVKTPDSAWGSHQPYDCSCDINGVFVIYDNTINTVSAFLQKYGEAEIEYKTTTSYIETIIPNRPLLALDQNGCDLIRSEWLKTLNKWIGVQGSLSSYTSHPYTMSESLKPNTTYTIYVYSDQNYTYSEGHWYLDNVGVGTIVDGILTNHKYTFTTPNSWTTLQFSWWGTFKSGNYQFMLTEGDHTYPYQENNGRIVHLIDLELYGTKPAIQGITFDSATYAATIAANTASGDWWVLKGTPQTAYDAGVLRTNGSTTVTPGSTTGNPAGILFTPVKSSSNPGAVDSVTEVSIEKISSGGDDVRWTAITAISVGNYITSSVWTIYNASGGSRLSFRNNTTYPTAENYTFRITAKDIYGNVKTKDFTLTLYRHS